MSLTYMHKGSGAFITAAAAVAEVEAEGLVPAKGTYLARAATLFRDESIELTAYVLFVDGEPVNKWE